MPCPRQSKGYDCGVYAVIFVLYELDSYGRSIWQFITDLTFHTLDLASGQKEMMVSYLQHTHRDLAPVLHVASNVLILTKETFTLGLQTANGGIDAVRFGLGMVSWVIGAMDRMRQLNFSGTLVVLLVAVGVGEMVFYARRNGG